MAIAVLAVLAASVPAPVQARLPDRPFGPGVDPAATYEPQRICDPHVKPGVRSFRRIVMRAFPNTGPGYFIRACWVGARSEHKGGRACDWMVSA